MSNYPSISSYFLSAALKHYKDGPARNQLLRRHHISPELLNSPSARIAGNHFADLLRDLMLTMEDEILGYGAQPQRLGCWQTMSKLACQQQDLQGALLELARFYRLIPWGVQSRFRHRGEIATFSLTPDAGQVFAPYLYESFLFYIYRMANWLISSQIPLTRVDFNFPRPRHHREYRFLFLCRNIRYEQDRCQLHFPASFQHRPVEQNALSLSRFLQHVNLSTIAQTFTRDSWRERVWQEIEQHLPRNVTFAEIASNLGLPAHQLRQHLHNEGYDYREIKDQLRRDRAIHFLSIDGLSVEQTSAQLGFSEPSAFIRAFKQWTGVQPGTYKRRRSTPGRIQAG